VSLSWEDLTPYQVDVLDAIVTEMELEEEHFQAKLALVGRLQDALGNITGSEVMELARHRAGWLEFDPYSRAVVDKSVDEQAWLDARRAGVTATEVAKLAQGQPAARATILAEKVSGIRTFFGNKYTEFGLEREPFICDQVRETHGFTPSDVLFHAVGNERHLATPDGVLVEDDGTVLLLEVKTGKNDLHPAGKEFAKTTYMDQMQWQMHVMGQNCKRTYFAWEQHDNIWVVGEDGRERPTPMPLKGEWIERDQLRIEYLITLADEFLDEVDWAIA